MTFGGASSRVADMRIQPDGRIVVAGIAGDANGARTFALVRYEIDGTLDRSFGEDGAAQTSIAPGLLPAAVVLQTDGRIVVVGSAFSTTFVPRTAHFLLARYLPVGVLDTSFGLDGIVTFASHYPPDEECVDHRDEECPGERSFGHVVLSSDQKIVAGGSVAGVLLDVYPAIARFTANSAPDLGFGRGGLVNEFPPGFVSVGTVAIRPDGKILAAMTSFLSQFTIDGRLDRDFAGQGWLDTQISSAVLALQADEKVLLAGQGPCEAGRCSGLVVQRRQADGMLDPTFGKEGSTTVALEGFLSVTVVAIKPDGKILVAGTLTGEPPCPTCEKVGLFQFVGDR